MSSGSLRLQRERPGPALEDVIGGQSTTKTRESAGKPRMRREIVYIYIYIYIYMYIHINHIIDSNKATILLHTIRTID